MRRGRADFLTLHNPKVMKNFEEASRQNWAPNPASRPPKNEELMLGCLQRLATASERQAAASEAALKLVQEVDARLRRQEGVQKENARQLTALKGTVSKLRKEVRGA